MIATNNIEKISIDQSFIYLQIEGKEIKIPLEEVSLKLKNAEDFQRNFYKVSPSGYGIHWPLIDEDLSIKALLKVYDKKEI